MSDLLIETFNQYMGGQRCAADVAAYLSALQIFPLPERVSRSDWRVHVPMHLLENWLRLSDDERVAVFVMAQCATHPYECAEGPELPRMN